MKASLSVAFMIFSLLLAFTTKTLLVLGAQAQLYPVIDIDGDMVVAGAEYYLMEWTGGAKSVNGGLDLSDRGRHQTCPLDVFRHTTHTFGRALTFSPAVETQENVIYQSSDLNIKFTGAPPICNNTTTAVWKVDSYDEKFGKWFITTNGVEGNPGAETLLNWFQFENLTTEAKHAYRIVHSPGGVCETWPHLSSNLGVYETDDGILWLIFHIRKDFLGLFPL
ncbi:21 kDa seed protein-like [Diospyros lotus]|uniref:21 kDa seed protein-like n=1 Tax=Diospyros lotus TaxID=55363 RepID=UPI002251A44A|nr:21 kDa seed protein-like [Diospyros lotus]